MIWGFVYGTFYTCSVQWNRYDAHPTVISLERDYRSWNGTLPGITLCYFGKVDEERAKQYIYKYEPTKVFSFILECQNYFMFYFAGTWIAHGTYRLATRSSSTFGRLSSQLRIRLLATWNFWPNSKRTSDSKTLTFVVWPPSCIRQPRTRSPRSMTTSMLIISTCSPSWDCATWSTHRSRRCCANRKLY